MSTVDVALVLLGEPRSLKAEELEPAVSHFTGTQRRRLELTLAAQGAAEQESLIAELQAARDDSPISDDQGNRWKVVSNSYSYQSNAAPDTYVHNVELEMLEPLVLERVEFEGIKLTPDRWSLRADDPDERGVLIMLLSLDTAAHEQLEAILESHSENDGYFAVNLIGIKSTPVSMRFGRCLWEPLTNNNVRHRIVLVTQEGDNDDLGVQFNQPETSRLIDQSIATAAKLDALIHELQQAGVVDPEALARINGAVDDPPKRARRVFDRAIGIERYFD